MENIFTYGTSSLACLSLGLLYGLAALSLLVIFQIITEVIKNIFTPSFHFHSLLL